MKPLLGMLLFTLVIFLGLECRKGVSDLPGDVLAKANVSCRSANPGQTLQWLKDIIVKAEDDKQTKRYMGNYMGKIFLTSYNNLPIFYIKMAMGSGGIYAYTYDCNGKNVFIEPNDMSAFEQNAQKQTLIYSNVPY